jgi:hypothetical protein
MKERATMQNCLHKEEAGNLLELFIFLGLIINNMNT